METKIAAIWARVSTEAQSELSLDGQIAEVKPYLEAQGYIVPNDKVVAVVWTSLDILRCPEMERLLDWVRNEEVAAIGVWHSDRLSGKPSHKAFILGLCERHNVKILSKTSPLLEGREGELVEFILTWSKENAVITTQINAKRGLKNRVLIKGLPPTMRAPYGYKWHNGKLVPSEGYDIARMIWDLGLKGTRIKSIGKQLYSIGIPSPRGHETWAASSIRGILANPAYAGRIACLKYERVEPKNKRTNSYGKSTSKVKAQEEWHWLDGLVESPIINWAEFEQVQQQLRLNQQYARRNAKRDYLLRGLIECQNCHRHYYGIHRSKEPPAYVCSNAWAQTYGKKCPSNPIACDMLEADVKDKILNFLKDPQVYLGEIQRRKEATMETVACVEKGISDLERQYNDTIFYEQKALRLLSEEAFEKEQRLIQAKRNWIKQEIGRRKIVLANLNELTIDEQAVQMMTAVLKSNLNGLTNDDWRRVFELLQVRVLAFPDRTWDVQIAVPAMSIVNRTPRSSSLWGRQPM
jgi:site-specific DNA recombinase